jgi:hypothetical protein
MIHVRAWSGARDYDADGTLIHAEDPTLQFTLTGRSDILKLQAVLARCLNTAPEFGKDWFELSDRVDQFIRIHKLDSRGG